MQTKANRGAVGWLVGFSVACDHYQQADIEPETSQLMEYLASWDMGEYVRFCLPCLPCLPCLHEFSELCARSALLLSPGCASGPGCGTHIESVALRACLCACSYQLR